MSKAATTEVSSSAVDQASRGESAARRSANPWIVGRWTDLSLIIGSPILVIGGLMTARQIWSGAAISSFVMIWAVGHHLPGMMRAYGDPQLFQRFRVRFIVAPLLLLSACLFAFITGVNSGLLSVAAIWGWWHYLMQAYGFSRIYDAKSGSFAASTRWLDQAMCLGWFAAAVVLNDNALYGFVQNFYNSGLPVPSADFIARLRSVVGSATAAITVLFALNWIVRYRAGDRPSWAKLAVMVSTFACFWYSAATVTNIVVAYAFFELFHDVQYLTIVWAFNRSRAEKDSSLRGFTPWLFQARIVFIGVYIAMIFGYGLLRYGGSKVADANLQRVVLAVFLTSTLLHYYFDGFIWKLREAGTQASLGLEAKKSAQRGWQIPLTLRHALLWCLFLAPYAVLLVSQTLMAMETQRLPDDQVMAKRLQESQQLVAAFPDSFQARFTLGLAYESMGMISESENAYEAALKRCPGYGPAEQGLARVSRRQGGSVPRPNLEPAEYRP